jgi:uncharacterized protein involved in exopolysaccharide biosynthesis
MGPTGPPPGRPGLPVHPYRLYRALMAGKWWLLGAAVLGLALGVGIAKLLMGSNYEAAASLKYEGVRSPSGEGRSDPAEVGSLAEAFLIEPVLRNTRQQLNLQTPLTALRARIEVDADTRAGTVRVRTGADASEQAAELANTLGEVFMRYHRERREQQLRSEISRVERRMRPAREALGEARATYDAFRETHGIADLSNEQQRGIETAAELQAQRDVAQSDIEALKARIQQLRRDVRTTPRMEVTSSQASAEARELSETQAALSAARASLSDDHPRVQALEQRVGTLRLRLHSNEGNRRGLEQMGTSSRRSTLETSLSEAQAELESAHQRLASLQELSAQAKERVAALSDIEGEASALLSQVRIHERVLNDLEEEHAQLIDLVGEPTSGFRVLTRATPPEHPEPSRRKVLAALLSPTLLLLLAAGVLLTRELWGGRLWTPAEVAYWGGAPVVGTTGWPRDPQGLDALVADLDDFVPTSAGEMLVVGVNERTAPLAREVADWLREDWSDTRLFGAVPSAPAPAHPPSRTLTPPTVTTAQMVVVPSTPHVAALPRDPRPHQANVDPGNRTEASPRLRVRPWLGPACGQGLRRAARLADRVLVTVQAGHATAAELAATRTRLGRDGGIGFVVVDLPPDLTRLADRVGPVEDFWMARRV